MIGIGVVRARLIRLACVGNTVTDRVRILENGDHVVLGCRIGGVRVRVLANAQV